VEEKKVTEPKEEQLTTEDWRDIRRAQQERRAERLPGRQQEITALSESGYTVKKLTEYQFRVNDKIDLYPIHRRYHHLKSGRRGRYRDLLALVESILKP
jgi:hypothetical protein